MTSLFNKLTFVFAIMVGAGGIFQEYQKIQEYQAFQVNVLEEKKETNPKTEVSSRSFAQTSHKKTPIERVEYEQASARPPVPSGVPRQSAQRPQTSVHRQLAAAPDKPSTPLPAQLEIYWENPEQTHYVGDRANLVLRLHNHNPLQAIDFSTLDLFFSDGITGAAYLQVGKGVEVIETDQNQRPKKIKLPTVPKKSHTATLRVPRLYASAESVTLESPSRQKLDEEVAGFTILSVQNKVWEYGETGIAEFVVPVLLGEGRSHCAAVSAAVLNLENENKSHRPPLPEPVCLNPRGVAPSVVPQLRSPQPLTPNTVATNADLRFALQITNEEARPKEDVLVVVPKLDSDLARYVFENEKWSETDKEIVYGPVNMPAGGVLNLSFGVQLLDLPLHTKICHHANLSLPDLPLVMSNQLCHLTGEKTTLDYGIYAAKKAQPKPDLFADLPFCQAELCLGCLKFSRMTMNPQTQHYSGAGAGLFAVNQQVGFAGELRHSIAPTLPDNPVVEARVLGQIFSDSSDCAEPIAHGVPRASRWRAGGAMGQQIATSLDQNEIQSLNLGLPITIPYEFLTSYTLQNAESCTPKIDLSAWLETTTQNGETQLIPYRYLPDAIELFTLCDQAQSASDFARFMAQNSAQTLPKGLYNPQTIKIAAPTASGVRAASGLGEVLGQRIEQVLDAAEPAPNAAGVFGSNLASSDFSRLPRAEVFVYHGEVLHLGGAYEFDRPTTLIVPKGDVIIDSDLFLSRHLLSVLVLEGDLLVSPAVNYAEGVFGILKGRARTHGEGISPKQLTLRGELIAQSHQDLLDSRAYVRPRLTDSALNVVADKRMITDTPPLLTEMITSGWMSRE